MRELYQVSLAGICLIITLYYLDFHKLPGTIIV